MGTGAFAIDENGDFRYIDGMLLDEPNCLRRRVFQIATLLGLGLATCATVILGLSQDVPAQAHRSFLDISAIVKYLPDSLKQEYYSPMLADDDVLFALDSTGQSLYLNFASNRKSSVMVVVDPARGEDSGLIWVSEPIEGHIDYFYATDINGDGGEEIVVSSRSISNRGGAGTWNRVQIWRWPSDANPDSVVALAPCSDTLNPYFQAMTKVEVIDTGSVPDGILEVVVTSIIGGGGLVNREPTTIRTVFYWTGEEYCVTRPKK